MIFIIWTWDSNFLITLMLCVSGYSINNIITNVINLNLESSIFQIDVPHHVALLPSFVIILREWDNQLIRIPTRRDSWRAMVERGDKMHFKAASFTPQRVPSKLYTLLALLLIRFLQSTCDFFFILYAISSSLSPLFILSLPCPFFIPLHFFSIKTKWGYFSCRLQQSWTI